MSNNQEITFRKGPLSIRCDVTHLPDDNTNFWECDDDEMPELVAVFNVAISLNMFRTGAGEGPINVSIKSARATNCERLDEFLPAILAFSKATFEKIDEDLACYGSVVKSALALDRVFGAELRDSAELHCYRRFMKETDFESLWKRSVIEAATPLAMKSGPGAHRL